MTTPADPEDPSAPSPPLDPVVEALARRVKASSLPQARALGPLSADERRALTDRLLGADEDAKPQETSAKEGPPATVPEPPAARPLPSPEVRKPRAWRWWPVTLAAALSVLVPTLVWLRPAPPSPALVAYDLRAEGETAVPGDPPPLAGAPLRLRPSTRLLVVLSPRGSAPDAALRMVVVRRGRAQLVRPPYEKDGRGQLTIDRPARDTLGDQDDGPAELVWLVGKAMPDEADLERIALDPGVDPPAGTTVVRRAAVFEDWAVPANPGGELPGLPGTTATPTPTPTPSATVTSPRKLLAIPSSPAPGRIPTRALSIELK